MRILVMKVSNEWGETKMNEFDAYGINAASWCICLHVRRKAMFGRPHDSLLQKQGRCSSSQSRLGSWTSTSQEYNWTATASDAVSDEAGDSGDWRLAEA
jgi:hypothetical protein